LVYIGGEQPLADGGSLKDLAPTMLAILGIQKPVEMDGTHLFNISVIGSD
jgi:2,3-bisphosphoglycerate-independent phosphoglycerate mutase